MAYTLRQFRQATRGLDGDLILEGIDEGSRDGSRPWQAYRVRYADVDVEQNPTKVELVLVPDPKAHGLVADTAKAAGKP